MPYLFCNVGWMEHYRGQTEKDQIVDGGSYVKKVGMGHEVCNFSSYRNTLYGYVQPPGKAKQIRIERLGAEEGDEFVSGVTVIWTARSPFGGTVVVGWYKEATVYRYYQKFDSPPPRHKNNGLDGYRIKALQKLSILLPIDERTFEIPRRKKGGMGNSNVWYADAPESKALKKDIARLISGKRKKPQKRRTRKSDPEKNAKVEKAAIKAAIKYFEDLDYMVNSVEKDNVGWDLEAKLGKKKLLIEVKGLSGTGLSVELTPNEYKALGSEEGAYRLCVVYAALDKPTLLVCRFSKEVGIWIVEGVQEATIDIKTKMGASIKIHVPPDIEG